MEADGSTVAFQGRTMVSWSEDAWFAMVTKLIFADSQPGELLWRYRGRLADTGHCYTFMLEHSSVGKMEGEGRIGEQTVVQRSWALNNAQQRSAFETFTCIDANTYHLAHTTMVGQRLGAVAEATLRRV